MKLKKIPIKKNPRKCPHPQQSNWHNSMTLVEKEEYRKKISLGMKLFHAKRTRKQEKLRGKNITKSKAIFYSTYKGNEEKLYRQYLSRNYQLSLEGEERKRILAKRGVGIQKFWDGTSIGRRQEIACKREITKMARLSNIFEFNVPREKDFCGVVYMEKETACG